MRVLDYLELIGREADIRTPVTAEEDAAWPEAGGYLGGAGTVTSISEAGPGQLAVTFADGTGAYIREDTEIAFVRASPEPPVPTALQLAVLLGRRVTVTGVTGGMVTGTVTRVADRKGGHGVQMTVRVSDMREEIVNLYGSETYSIGV
jgi:hypothetical protein